MICYAAYETSTAPASYSFEQDVVLDGITGVSTGTVQYTISNLDDGHYWFSVRAYRVEDNNPLRSGYADPVTNNPDDPVNAGTTNGGGDSSGGGGGCFIKSVQILLQEAY